MSPWGGAAPGPGAERGAERGAEQHPALGRGVGRSSAQPGAGRGAGRGAERGSCAPVTPAPHTQGVRKPARGPPHAADQ